MSEARTYPPGSLGAMFPEVAELTEALLAERNALEVRLGEVMVQRDQARRIAEDLEQELAELSEPSPEYAVQFVESKIPDRYIPGKIGNYRDGVTTEVQYVRDLYRGPWRVA